MRIKLLQTSALVFLALLALVMLLKTLSSIFLPFTFSLFLSILLTPLFQSARKKKIPLFLIVTLFIIFLFLIFYGFGIVFFSESVKVAKAIPFYQERVNVLSLQIANFFGVESNFFLFGDILNFSSISKILQPGLKGFQSFITFLILTIFFTIFLLPYKKSFEKKLKALMSGSQNILFQSAVSKTETSIRNYLYIKLLVSIATASVSALIMFIFGVDFILLLSMLIFFLNFIPNIGSIFATIFPLSLYLLKFGFTIQFIWLFLLLLGTQLFFGNYLEPKIAGKKLNISPFIILLSMLVWFWIWGIPGMFLSVPLTSVCKILLEHAKSTKKFAVFLEQ